MTHKLDGRASRDAGVFERGQLRSKGVLRATKGGGLLQGMQGDGARESSPAVGWRQVSTVCERAQGYLVTVV